MLGVLVRVAPPARWRTENWAAYAACAWSLVFAAMSFYWAVGGRAGIATQGPTIRDLAEAREPWFVAVLWITGVLKVVGALLALARPTARRILRRPLLVLGWGAGVGMVLYGGVPLVVGGLALARVIGGTEPVDRPGLWWHVLLWDPWWMLGGSLFAAAALSYQGHSRLPGVV
jgi:hypothetical protein